MSASWASHLYTREICGCVEKAAVWWAQHVRHWESTATVSIGFENMAGVEIHTSE
jgi:hypothetical protein